LFNLLDFIRKGKHMGICFLFYKQPCMESILDELRDLRRIFDV